MTPCLYFLSNLSSTRADELGFHPAEAGLPQQLSPAMLGPGMGQREQERQGQVEALWLVASTSSPASQAWLLSAE